MGLDKGKAKPFKTFSVAAARTAADKKAEDVLLLDVSDASPLADFLLIVTALSRPHLEALEDDIEKTAAQFSILCLRKARPASDRWRVLDFGGLIVHLMDADARALYALEDLHSNARRVPWTPRAAKASAS